MPQEWRIRLGTGVLGLILLCGIGAGVSVWKSRTGGKISARVTDAAGREIVPVYHENALPDAVFDRILADCAAEWVPASPIERGERLFQVGADGRGVWTLELTRGKTECRITLWEDGAGGVYEVRRLRNAGENTDGPDAQIRRLTEKNENSG